MCGYYNFRCEYAREWSTCHAMKGYVYILASKRSGTLYRGVTRDPPRRIAIFTVYRPAEGPHPPRSHSCARHRDESSAASAARKSCFSPRTWSGWIPVTSTGMRKSNKWRQCG